MHLGVVMCVRVNDNDFRNKTSISILRMRNDAETILKSRVPLVPSLYCHWNDSTNMCRACHLRNPQHETHFLNSLVGYRMRRIVGINIKITNTQTAIAEKYGILLCMTFYSWVIVQNTLVLNITKIIMNVEGVQQCMWRIQIRSLKKREVKML